MHLLEVILSHCWTTGLMSTKNRRALDFMGVFSAQFKMKRMAVQFL